MLSYMSTCNFKKHRKTQVSLTTRKMKTLMQNIIMTVVLIHALQFFIRFLFTEIGSFKCQMPLGWLPYLGPG